MPNLERAISGLNKKQKNIAERVKEDVVDIKKSVIKRKPVIIPRAIKSLLEKPKKGNKQTHYLFPRLKTNYVRVLGARGRAKIHQVKEYSFIFSFNREMVIHNFDEINTIINSSKREIIPGTIISHAYIPTRTNIIWDQKHPDFFNIILLDRLYLKKLLTINKLGAEVEGSFILSRIPKDVDNIILDRAYKGRIFFK